jgi:hypothetical protein
MALRYRLSIFVTALLSALAVGAAAPTAALAGGSVVSGTVGSDISWPQCGTAYPGGYGFGIIGVTGGHPFSSNDCFGSEFQWAQATGNPQIYINLDYGLRQDGPLLCSTDDTGCQAYNYGYDAAQWARSYAGSQTGGASDTLGTWWLDVETENYWSDDPDQNSYVIQGALDYLQRVAGRTVGVYSTPWMWGQLAGSFSPPNTPNWIAGANGLDDASKCAASLWPGGQVWAIQYLNLDINLDQDTGC